MAPRKSRSRRRHAGRPSTQRRLLVEHLGERRVLAAIAGAVFEDLNHSFQKDAGEVNVPHRLIYIDSNANAAFDTNESFVVAESDGSFVFTDLDDGSYLLRLFNGTQTQTQSIPVEATIEGNAVSVSGGIEFAPHSSGSLVLTNDSLVIGNLTSGSGTTLSVGNQLTSMETLPDGRLLIVGTETSGDTSWVVDPATETVTSVDLTGGGSSVAWAELAIDSGGHGVLLEEAAGSIAVRSIDASDSGSGIQVSLTDTFVPSDTQVLASETGNRSVFAWSGSEGLQLSLWSNVTASFISSAPIGATDTTQLLAFDDSAGLLALRTTDGGVSVHDVDAGFATLHTLADASGPVAIDSARDLLMTISPVDAMLKLINLRDGTVVADLAIDLSTVGQISSLAMEGEDSVVVLGAAGITEVALRKAAAHEITISDNQDADPILFGVSLKGSNSAPEYLEIPEFTVEEDTSLQLSAPGALTGSADSDGDDFVVIQLTDTENGTATIATRGTIDYVPDADFFGTETVRVVLHDGQDMSVQTNLNVVVTPVPDPPIITITTDPVPEDIPLDTPIGTIDIIDVDGVIHIIEIDDPRFGHSDGNIIIIGGPFDFENERIIPIDITITNPDTNDIIERNASVAIQDANDPITAITPTAAFVFENAPGDIIAELLVHDEDEEQFHTFEVDDDRFTVDGIDLRLKTGISVDFELEEEIVVNVTATEVPNGGTFTQAITIQVRDLPEQPQEVGLTNETVIELVAGAVVGDVTVEGQSPPDSRFLLTVDDSRFEIEGSTLRLRDDIFVERAAQQEIQLSISAEDSQGEFTTITGTFLIEVLENETPFHNPDVPWDVDHGGEVTALDALAIINYLNTFGPGPVGQGTSALCYDVNADGFVTALDALLVLNQLNQNSLNGEQGGVNGEGEQVQEGENEEGLSSGLSSGALVTGARPQDEPLREPLHGKAESLLPTPKLVDTSILSIQLEQAIEILSSESPEEFAAGVDETLRLLSEKASK